MSKKKNITLTVFCILIVSLGITFVASSALGVISSPITTTIIGEDITTRSIAVSDLVGKTNRTATIVVAAHNSSTSSRSQADFVADGVGDQAEIQAAINSLPASGGKVMLMEGIYNVVPQPATWTHGIPWLTNWLFAIEMRSNVTLKGQGSGTILRLAPGHTTTGGAVIVANGVPNIKITQLSIDLNGAGSTHPTWNIWVGIMMRSPETRNSIIYGNRIFNATYGENIMATEASTGNIIAFNVLRDGGDGVGLNDGSFNVVIGNFVENAFTEGIDLYRSSSNTVTSNTITNSRFGIGLRSGSNENTIVGNIVNLSREDGISILSSNYNTFSDNSVTKSSQMIDMGFHSVRLTESSFNLIQGNIICRGNRKNQAHSGIAILLATSTENVIKNNQIQDSGRVGPLVNEGTRTVIMNNQGYIVENSESK